jgi:hypothetical protein
MAENLKTITKTRNDESTKEKKNEKDKNTIKCNAPKIQCERLWQFVVGI